jgi:hypothetical protein
LSVPRLSVGKIRKLSTFANAACAILLQNAKDYRCLARPRELPLCFQAQLSARRVNVVAFLAP